MIPSFSYSSLTERAARCTSRWVGPQKHEHRSKFGSNSAVALTEAPSFRAFEDLAERTFVLSRTTGYAS
ncbi:hypothetical protein SAMN05216557_107135 [Sphingomonas carotinifaciens]|uniref:Uncharacterized protein n=1 Tax=Sphingomonas carotinifaciens TaxID=1166323 RepID=A0A1G7PYE8_9SPHN|nr:hypothetical protein [Sphingomonas carotinifaciens]SDF91285.1 hypothetical protein SAMN05216557_107135 [Sphingomonas carotinifaciens]